MQEIKREVHKRDKEMVLEKCATADWSLAAVKIEERIILLGASLCGRMLLSVVKGA